ncbi:MAG TPA: CotH kinase family protein [Flavobacteriales bacterium]|nr:CotH kinase family protein [Flavobacteriales bacterium]
MRAWAIPLLLLGTRQLLAQGGLLINEVIADDDAARVCAIELFSAGPGAVQLQGYRIAAGTRQAVIQRELLVQAGEVALLTVGTAGDLPDVELDLSTKGATLLLTDPSGTIIQDVFHYPELPVGTSWGRSPDGGLKGTYFRRVGMEGGEERVEAVGPPHPAPTISRTHGVSGPVVRVQGGLQDSIWVSVDGRSPEHGAVGVGTVEIPLTRDMVVHARTRSAKRLPSPAATGTFLVDTAAFSLPVVALTMDPEDLHGRERGIDTPGDHANFSRKGRDWERSCTMVVGHGQGEAPLQGGIRIAGSGSRGRVKRSFKFLLKDRFLSPEVEVPWFPAEGLDECLLRADAAPHSFLQHLLIEEAMQEVGTSLDIPPSLPVRLFINAQDRGLYRMMPPKDAQWFKRTHGSADLDLLEGPSYAVREGDRAHWERVEEILFHGGDRKALEPLVDLQALVDLACLDLYTGRADHDLNVRAWRPRGVDGRWGWVLFDLDLWAPAHENTVQRMSLAVTPGTPFVPQLLEENSLQELLLSRMSALLAGPLAPERMNERLDALSAMYAKALLHDHGIWQDSLSGALPPDGSQDVLSAFLQERPARVLHQLASHTGHDLVTMRMTCDPPEGGSLQVERVDLGSAPDPSSHFAGIPLHIVAVPRPGWRHIGWKGSSATSQAITVDPRSARRITARFAPERSGVDHP